MRSQIFLIPLWSLRKKNILTFEKEKDDLWRINSVWFNKDQNNIYVMYPELINACTSFINKLKNDFKGIT
ncbi:hypothetical protein M1J14_003351, partial [Acinetobacter baumannii]